jgi:hypothetical protein
MGCLPETPTPAATGSEERAPPPHSPPGQGELKMGVPPHPGRAAEAGPALLPPDRAQGAAPPWPATRAAPRPALLARVRPPARRPDPSDRLLQRGHDLADSVQSDFLQKGGTHLGRSLVVARASRERARRAPSACRSPSWRRWRRTGPAAVRGDAPEDLGRSALTGGLAYGQRSMSNSRPTRSKPASPARRCS